MRWPIELETLGRVGEVLGISLRMCGLAFLPFLSRAWEPLFGGGGVEPLRLVAMRGDDGDLVGVVAGEVGVDEDKKIGHRSRQGQRGRQ